MKRKVNPELLKIHAHLSNREIAKIFNVSSTAISYWRRKLKLTATGSRKKVDPDMLRNLWLSGVSIKEIAQQLNVHRETVRYWVRKQNLPKRKHRISKVDLEELKNLVSMGLSSTEIVKRLGVSRNVVMYWRKKLGLPQKWRWMGRDDLKKVEELYLNGHTVREIVAQTGWSLSTIYKALKKLGIRTRTRRRKLQPKQINGAVEKLDGITYVKSPLYDWYKLWLDEAIETIKLLKTYTPYYEFLLRDWYDNICSEIKENLPLVVEKEKMLRNVLARQIKILKIENETRNC